MDAKQTSDVAKNRKKNQFKDVRGWESILGGSNWGTEIDLTYTEVVLWSSNCVFSNCVSPFSTTIVSPVSQSRDWQWRIECTSCGKDRLVAQYQRQTVFSHLIIVLLLFIAQYFLFLMIYMKVLETGVKFPVRKSTIGQYNWFWIFAFSVMFTDQYWCWNVEIILAHIVCGGGLYNTFFIKSGFEVLSYSAWDSVRVGWRLRLNTHDQFVHFQLPYS